MHRLHSNHEQFNLLRRKGVYPYEYMDCAERMSDTALPHRSCSSVDSPMNTSVVQTIHLQKTPGQNFGIQSMREDHDLYLETDVVLLADVFEEFRKMTLNYYGQDALHYFSSPASTHA
jgi:hypothetical protein